MAVSGGQIEHQLARFATTDVLDDDARRIMRLSIFDWAACALAGQHEPVVRILLHKGRHEGGAPQATVIGGDKLPAPRAALINGAISHALDYDDTHFDHIGHTSVAVVPAALAMAQTQGRTMAQLVDAALIGSEAAVRIGTWLGRDHYQVGFHQTATSGAFGAVLASLRLMDSIDPMIIAGLGLVATRAAGLKSQFGTMGKPLNAGLAAEAGVEAALWAQAGMTSTDLGLSGPLGFAETHHGQRNETALQGLGSEWRMSSISHKFHACCHGLHAMLEALGSLDLDAAQVSTIHIATHPRWMSVCNKPTPRSGLEAKFSYAQTAAMALMGVNTGTIAAFSDEVALHPIIGTLRVRVQVDADDTLRETQARVTVLLVDGQQRQAFYDLAQPLPVAELGEKLQRKASNLVGAQMAEKLYAAVHGDDLPVFCQLLGEQIEPEYLRGLDITTQALEFSDGQRGQELNS